MFCAKLLLSILFRFYYVQFFVVYFFHSIVATLLNSIKYRDGKTAQVHHFVQVLSLSRIFKIQN